MHGALEAASSDASLAAPLAAWPSSLNASWAAALTASPAHPTYYGMMAAAFTRRPSHAAPAVAPPSVAPASVVAASDPRIRYHGRWVRDAGSAACAWPMSGFSFSLSGAASCTAKLAAPGDGGRLLVRVDGATVGYVELAAAAPTAWYTLASGLDPRVSHAVEVYKVTEDKTFGKGSVSGVLRLEGIAASGDGQIIAGTLSPPPPRRLEFIGDSDTAGWCADGKPFHQGKANAVENAYETWAMQLARTLNASEVMVEAISGYGVEPHTGQIQGYYRSALAFAPAAPEWNFSAWVPDAVVVLIGPNDEGRDDAKFVKDYLDLCNEVATAYAHAPTPPKLVHVCGGSINGLDPCDDIRHASDLFNRQPAVGRAKMRSYYTSITTAHWHEINRIGSSYLGCDLHYGPKGHAMLAADIAPQLRSIMGW